MRPAAKLPPIDEDETPLSELVRRPTDTSGTSTTAEPSSSPADGGAQEPAPAAGDTIGEILHPGSRIKDMQARLRELMQPIYGNKEQLWERLSKAEERHAKHLVYMGELERRQEAARQGQEGAIAMRTVPGPAEPTPEERARHETLHLPPADCCIA